MKYVLLMTLFFITFFNIHAQDFELKTLNKNYTINCDKVYYNYINYDDKFSSEFDSTFTIKMREETIVGFMKKDILILCRDIHDKLYLNQLIEQPESNFLKIIQYKIFNTPYIITLWQGNENIIIHVVRITNNPSSLYNRLQLETDLYLENSKVSSISNDNIKIVKNKIYILYEYGIKNNVNILKYGVLEITNDKSKEFYFRPLSVTTLEEWGRNDFE